MPTQENPDATRDAAAAAFWLGLRMFHIFEYVEGNGEKGFQIDSADNITGGYDLSHAVSLLFPFYIIQCVAFQFISNQCSLNS